MSVKFVERERDTNLEERETEETDCVRFLEREIEGLVNLKVCLAFRFSLFYFFFPISTENLTVFSKIFWFYSNRIGEFELGFQFDIFQS